MQVQRPEVGLMIRHVPFVLYVPPLTLSLETGYLETV